MANQALIARMRHLLDDYRQGRLSAESWERSIEGLLGGLEGMRLATLGEARDLAHRLYLAEVYRGEDTPFPTEDLDAILAEFHRYLDDLATRIPL